ncbi:MAG: CoB--CoM heterodisulfide reductase subunit C [Candidatus Bathyarchaeia archaeon]
MPTSIQESRSRAVETVLDELISHSRNLLKCVQCGACTGSCPSGRRTQLRVRRLMEKVLMGFEDVLNSDDLWLCTTCYVCFDRCPRDAQPTSVIKRLRNIAVRKGFMKAAHQKVARLFCDTGHLVPINDEVRAVRKSLGLSELPPTVHSYPESLKELETILEATGFRRMTG